jgi:hypothetical protein
MQLYIFVKAISLMRALICKRLGEHGTFKEKDLFIIKIWPRTKDLMLWIFALL